MNTSRSLSRKTLFSALGVGLLVFGLFRGVGGCSELQSQSDRITTSALDSVRSQFKFPARTATDGTDQTFPARSVIPDAAVAALNTNSAGNLVPSDTSLGALVTLAASADAATAIATNDGKMRLDVALRGGKASVHASSSGGNALYAGGGCARRSLYTDRGCRRSRDIRKPYGQPRRRHCVRRRDDARQWAAPCE